MSGLEVQSQLGKISPSTRVIIFTGKDDPLVRSTALNAGASAFLTKPFDDEELLTAVRLALTSSDMKISFPKYGPGELLTQKRLATCIISFVALAVFAGALGSYLLENKFWLLTIAVLGIAGILFCLGVAIAIFLNQSKVNETPITPILPSRKACRDLHLNGIIGPEDRFEHAPLSTAQAQKRLMI